ncbi:MAG: hypothetical protein AAF191_07610 [Verrucomicrobiota bacterium]
MIAPSVSQQKGYLLLEVILAVTIFALSFVGLMRVLQLSQRTATEFAWDTHLQFGLEAILAEASVRPPDDMQMENQDDVLGIVYRTVAEPLEFSASTGNSLDDLYRLRAIATFDRGRGPETQEAERWLYRPEEEE